VELHNHVGEKLDYTLIERDNSPYTVIIGHGVTGNKDRPFLVALAESLNHAGITTLRFSFAGNGDSEGEFTDATISKEVEDLGTVLDALEGADRRSNKICYVGHSMGGAVGVLRTSQDERIRLLISLAGMVRTKKFAETEFGEKIPGQGFMWDEPTCPLSQAYMDDLSTIDTVEDSAVGIHVPWLLVHGTEDDVVLIDDSETIFEKANSPKKLVVINEANHVFSDEAQPKMVQAVVEWIIEQTKA